MLECKLKVWNGQEDFLHCMQKRMTGILETAAAITPAVLPPESASASAATGDCKSCQQHAHCTRSAGCIAHDHDKGDGEQSF